MIVPLLSLWLQRKPESPEELVRYCALMIGGATFLLIFLLAGFFTTFGGIFLLLMLVAVSAASRVLCVCLLGAAQIC